MALQPRISFLSAVQDRPCSAAEQPSSYKCFLCRMPLRRRGTKHLGGFPERGPELSLGSSLKRSITAVSRSCPVPLMLSAHQQTDSLLTANTV